MSAIKFISIFSLIGFLFVFLIACEDDDSDIRESMTGVSSVSVPESVKINEDFDLSLKVFGSSSCAEFSRFTASESGDTTIFKFYQKRDGSLVCSTIVIEIPVEVSLKYESTGKKYLKFNAEPSIFSDDEMLIIDSLIVDP